MQTSQQRGDRWGKKPGTCEQTGNSAPKYSWKGTAFGRVALVTIVQSAHLLGYDDERMGRAREFPHYKELRLVTRTLPWFEEHYNQYREEAVQQSGYTGKLEPFGLDDLWNRLHYMYTKPGTIKQPRRYAACGNEHPFSMEQSNKKLSRTWTRCAVIIDYRLIHSEIVTEMEALRWGGY